MELFSIKIRCTFQLVSTLFLSINDKLITEKPSAAFFCFFWFPIIHLLLFTLPAKAVLSLLNACNLSLITLQI